MAARLRPELASDLVELLRVPGRLLLILDFDGTVSPIVPTLDLATMLPAARRALRRIAALNPDRGGRVETVFLSGRSVRDLAVRVRIGGVRYLGTHGVESGALRRGGRAETIETSLDPAVRGYRPLMESIAESVVHLVSADWLLVELKGPNVAFHYRLAPDPEAARAAILAAVRRAIEPGVAPTAATAPPAASAPTAATAASAPIEVAEGRKVIELRPAVAGVDKASAVERLLATERPAAILALGDDRPDAEAFARIREARQRGDVKALILGVAGRDETPPELVAVADRMLESPVEAARALSHLAALLERERA